MQRAMCAYSGTRTCLMSVYEVNSEFASMHTSRRVPGVLDFGYSRC